MRFYAVCVTALLPLCAFAREETQKEPERIRDNLILLEEAYNQEPGVIQHIFVTYLRPKKDIAWSLSFTQEWPVPTETHQLSYTIVTGKDEATGKAYLDDIMLNYRHQAVLKQCCAFAPRFSLILPTSTADDASKVLGIEIGLPFSLEIGRYFAVHVNAGTTLRFSAVKKDCKQRHDIETFAGIAPVFAPFSFLNFLVEVLHRYRVRDDIHTLIISPEMRFALDFDVGSLQIVPALGAPMEVLNEEKQFKAGIFLYLSLEHRAFSVKGK